MNDVLEPRLVLSRVAPALLARAGAGLGAGATSPRTSAAVVHRTPAVEFNAQLAAFTNDVFQNLLPLYLSSVQGVPPGLGTINATLSAPHAPYSGTLSLSAGSGILFGNPTTASPITVSVLSATDPNVVLAWYQASGRVGDVLTGVHVYDPSASRTNESAGAASSSNSFQGGPSRQDPPAYVDPALPAGALVRIATPGFTPTVFLGSNYQNALAIRANQMAQSLVAYFNSLPPKLLPPSLGGPRTPGPRNIVQQYVYSRVMGDAQDSLLPILLSVPLPSDAGASLAFYQSAVQSAIDAWRVGTLDGLKMIWSGRVKAFPIY